MRSHAYHSGDPESNCGLFTYRHNNNVNANGDRSFRITLWNN